jgi:ubiquinone biosynthesis protein
VVHADLHPGNMLLLDDGRLAVFDVGLVLHVPRELLVQLVDFARCVSFGTWMDFVNHLKRFHTYMEGVDWSAVEVDAEAFVQKFRDSPALELEFGKFTEDLFALARNHDIRPLPEMTLILVGVITAEGIGKILAPEVQSFHEIAAYIMPLLPTMGLSPNAAVPVKAAAEPAGSG